MVGKAGVWAHFGSWDFDRAKLWQDVRAGKIEGVDESTVAEIMITKGDKWISPWPSYQGAETCKQETNDTILCGDYARINLTDMSIDFGDGSKPAAFSYIKDNFTIDKYDNNNGLGISLLPDTKTIVVMDPTLVGSMFNRMFFYDGIGLEHFIPFYTTTDFTGSRILIYKIYYGQ